jgi:hypothetical protein
MSNLFLENKAEDDSKPREKSKSSKYVHFTKIIEVSYKYTTYNRAFLSQKSIFFKNKSVLRDQIFQDQS